MTLAAESAPDAGGRARNNRAAQRKLWLKRAEPLLFVLVGFACWFLFVILARVVLKCAPAANCSVSDLAPADPIGWPDTVILLTTMCFAIWASKRMVFGSED